MNAAMAWRSWVTFLKLVPRSALRARMPNQISTWFNQLAEAGDEMKMHVGMQGQPVIAALVSAVIIQNDAQLPVGGRVRHDLIHELHELRPPFKGGGIGLDESRGHLQGRK